MCFITILLSSLVSEHVHIYKKTKALSNILLISQREIKILIGRHTLLVMKKLGYESVHRNGPHGYRVVELTGDEIYNQRRFIARETLAQ